MTYKGGYGDGYAGTAVLEPPPGGTTILTPHVPPRRRPQHRQGRAVLVLFAEVSAPPGAATHRAELHLTVGARAYDPMLEERRDRTLIAAFLAEAGIPGRITLPAGQQDAAWDRYRAEEEAELRRRLLDPPSPEVPGGP